MKAKPLLLIEIAKLSQKVITVRIILLHSDEFSYEAKRKAIKNAEQIETAKAQIKEAVVALIAVEKNDENNISHCVQQATTEIVKVANQLNCKNIVCYPWVHLSSNPANPVSALKILKGIEISLQKTEAFDTILRAPFGWYKTFSVTVKGHPLSELSRTIDVKEKLEEKKDEKETTKHPITSLQAEGTVTRKFHIMNSTGELISGKDYKFNKKDDIYYLYKYETAKDRTSTKPPAHIALMKRLALVDYEPASDPGNMRWYPAGWTMKRILEDYVINRMIEYGAYCLETPIMYDFKHPSLEAYMNRFPARQYTIKSNERNYFLRFAACFGQFLIAADSQISYKNLPLKLFEMTHYSFRKEQRGELAGLRRLRTFSMPDLHTITENLEMAKHEFSEQYKLSLQMMKDFEIDFQAVFRFQRDFYYENENWVKGLTNEINKPVMLELFDQRYAYFICKFEFNVIDGQKKAAALTTVQIDVENAKRFNITYTDKDGNKQYPYILHTSPSGAIERVIYGILEKAARTIKIGKKPTIAFWLNPVQARICPITEEQFEECDKLLQDLQNINLRIDIDDRGERVGKMIREAEKSWIPYILIIGKKEIEANEVVIRIRDGKEIKIQRSEVITYFKKLLKNFPTRKLPMSPYLSKRPIFT